MSSPELFAEVHTKKSKRKREESNISRQVASFVHPKTPRRKSGKTFKPTILIHEPNSSRTESESSFDFHNDSQPLISFPNNLNDSFMSCASYNSGYGTMTSESRCNIEDHMNESFHRINSYIDQLTTDILSLPEPNGATPSTYLPKLTFNENSVDLRLAFTDFRRFISKIHEENMLFDSEADSEVILGSQIIESQQDFSVEVEAERNYDIDSNLPPAVIKLQKGLNAIYESENFQSPTRFKRPSPLIINDLAKNRIRRIFEELSSDLDAGKKLQIKFPKITWKCTVYENGILVLKTGKDQQFSILRSRTSTILYLLRKIYGLLTLNTKLTQRSIYYQLESLLGTNAIFSPAKVANGLNTVCSMLDLPYWNLNVITTSKGLIYGDVTLTIGDTDIKCNAQNGTVIPTDLNQLTKVKSDAYFVLIVEKDTVFQKLLADDLPNTLSRNFILITGKGFPDINTRRLLNILWTLLGIPMFIVVDADSYGIEILLTYKFGSLNQCHLNREIALPKLKWLGVLPSEFGEYEVQTLPQTPRHAKHLKAILTRPYFRDGHNARLQSEITALIKSKKLCEIEGLFQTNKWFAKYYLPLKLYQRSFV